MIILNLFYVIILSLLIQVKVLSEFRKASLTYLENISALKVEFLGKMCKLFSKSECRIILAVLVFLQEAKRILLKKTKTSLSTGFRQSYCGA